MIKWKNPWKMFNKEKDKESYFLGELSWELEPHSTHELFRKCLEIIGWIPGYDHFILRDNNNKDFFYVRLTWNKDGRRLAPQFLKLIDEHAVNEFIDKNENNWIEKNNF